MIRCTLAKHAASANNSQEVVMERETSSVGCFDLSPLRASRASLDAQWERCHRCCSPSLWPSAASASHPLPTACSASPAALRSPVSPNQKPWTRKYLKSYLIVSYLTIGITNLHERSEGHYKVEFSIITLHCSCFGRLCGLISVCTHTNVSKQ